MKDRLQLQPLNRPVQYFADNPLQCFPSIGCLHQVQKFPAGKHSRFRRIHVTHTSEHLHGLYCRHQPCDLVGTQQDPWTAGRIDAPFAQGLENGFACKLVAEDRRESAGGRTEVCKSRMTVVAITASNHSETVAAVENIPHEVSLVGAVDRNWRVERFAAAMNGGDLGDGLEDRIRRIIPVGRDGAPLEFEDNTSLPLLEVAIRSVVALRDKMTAKQLFDALDLLDEQWVDPMGCDSG